MRKFIRRATHGLSLLLASGTGNRRAGRGPANRRHPAQPTAVPERLPLHRSPYGLGDPLDGTANRLVRPYLAAHEDEVAQQRHHCLAHHLIGAPGVTVR
ncbi:hypothetical protein F9278_16695 [Streptomyces phaeolivaceus]|uniref:Uncharacterized protein n=1 Tax=Streptomyces phaeolivaceus TaxID=2653200 RepID=A0A5P8K3G6_9ACTN|nr:hypothetical protein [Streptomyces phaeolivaceus]QFQ97586.1 hypothetical protein F9278_16695 [Streptomyces phaeolivaceus]